MLDPAPDPELFLIALPQGLPGDQYKVTGGLQSLCPQQSNP